MSKTNNEELEAITWNKFRGIKNREYKKLGVPMKERRKLISEDWARHKKNVFRQATGKTTIPGRTVKTLKTRPKPQDYKPPDMKSLARPPPPGVEKDEALCALSKEGFFGEFHAYTKGCKHNFTGPGTKLRQRLARGDVPINDIDRASRAHDIGYGKLDKKTATKEQVRRIDNVYVEAIKKTKDDPELAKQILGLFRLKRIGEDLGFLDYRKFL